MNESDAQVYVYSTFRHSRHKLLRHSFFNETMPVGLIAACLSSEAASLIKPSRHNLLNECMLFVSRSIGDLSVLKLHLRNTLFLYANYLLVVS